MTRTKRDIAIKKVEIAIDKMVDLQDMGLGNSTIQECLEKLNHLHLVYTNINN